MGDHVQVITPVDLTEAVWAAMTDEEREAVTTAMHLAARSVHALFRTIFPADGPLARRRYWWAVAFWAAGQYFKQRGIMAANQVGKTTAAAYELACHVTGQYPDWWRGKRFHGPTTWWVAGDTKETTRDILQGALLGPPDTLETEQWSGMLPPEAIDAWTPKSGIANAVDTLWVKHTSGSEKRSAIRFKSYDQGRRSFQGVPLSGGVWLDEEPPEAELKDQNTQHSTNSIYSECLMRISATDGILIWTWTPLRGMTRFIADYLASAATILRDGTVTMAKAIYLAKEGDASAGQVGIAAAKETGRFVVGATWDDAPHLDATRRRELTASMQPYERDARTRGIPSLGAGAVYPAQQSEIEVDPFAIPKHWHRFGSLDVGASSHPTAGCWWAYNPLDDPATRTLYLYDVYKRTTPELDVHTAAILGRGKWIKFAGDAAAMLVTERDAEQMLQLYRKAGVDVVLARKSVEVGVQQVWNLITQGRLKVFSTCSAWFVEWRMYRRAENGRIVKTNDDLMDATRYGVVSGIHRAGPPPDDTDHADETADDELLKLARAQGGSGHGWMG